MVNLKTVLVVDDNALNRSILKKILSENYNIMETENCSQAIEALKERADEIAIVILNITPIKDGYIFLETVHRDTRYSNIPVIVTAKDDGRKNEGKILSLGAWDFISQPYEPSVIKIRVKNAIQRSQFALTNQLKYLSAFDTLTGTYNKSKFFSATREMIDNDRESRFIFLRFDVDRFQLINSFFGMEEGDKLLKFIAQSIRVAAKRFSKFTYGRMESDVFCCCFPYDKVSAQEIVKESKIVLTSFNPNYDIVPSVGLYIIDDNNISVETMYNRASLAAKTCKGNYVDYFAYYDESMSAAITAEQEITNEMISALEGGQFEIYLQPKLNIQVNKMCGAEALVRWRHPIRGLLSPGEFIPVFERNGFIIKLDYYVWEQVCKCLRRWLDEGKTPYPISVNVSRVNLYNPKLAELILQLVKKYNLSPSLLNLELTESAYTDNPIASSETIALLQSYGFVILMDDFGSGYSSLNILKDISVDELKIDMRFLSATKIPGRGENIIASVVRMAKWLNIPVVTEGVETKEQTDFLRSIGCDCIQGYYYAKPMKVSEYEDLCNRQFIGLNPIEKQVDGQYQYDEIFAQNPEMTKLFINSYKAAAIYEFSVDGIELLRVNNVYYTLFGQHAMTENTRDLLAAVDTEYKDIVQEAFAACVKTKKPTECEYVRRRADGLPVWAHVELAYVSKIGDKSIVSGVLTDNTLKKEIEKELQNYREALLSQHDDTNTILIVDDAVTNRIILKKIFEPQFKILEAENGEEALKILKDKMEEIDLILLDIMMPVMDGREFLKEKQKIPALDDTPVMIITADDSDAQQVEALSLGARDYIVKPFNAELVVRRVKNVMGFSRQFKEMAREYSNMSEMVKKDPMTGLLNRISTEAMITQHLENTSDIHAMMMLDVDNFKNINDTYGHVIGDEVICAVAKRLKLFFRQSDIVARMGGDEFSVFIGHIPEAEVAEKKAIELCRSMADMVIGDENMRISCSVGVAVSNSDEDTFETLYVNADKALYNAKCNGKGSVSVFGKDDAEFFVKRISDAEGILNDIQDSLLICSLETNSILYANDYVCKQLGIDKKDIIGRKCHEVLMGTDDYCKGCPKNKPNQADVSGKLLHYSKSGKTFMLRGKYINWNGIPAYMELAVDVTGMDMCHVMQADEQKN